jgi:endonuclease/exonuclease/phosphatase family metal-dependent hydrolase
MNAGDRDSLLVMFWNVENFFDWIDQGTGESDNEFSSTGSRHWTRKKFYVKCDAVAKSIMWVGDKYGRLPDVIGFSEIENRGVLTRLLSSTLLRKYDYGIIHHDSSDPRGIDVALLYRKSSLHPITTTFICSDSLLTRDILHAQMCLSDGQRVDFLVNHHPSKYGGALESIQKRKHVMSILKDTCDSLLFAGSNKILAMGDFNDTPDALQFQILDGVLQNSGLKLHEDGKGSIRYKGRWELIDFFLSKGLETSQMEVLQIPFLMTYDRSYPGHKPLRTYSGPRYIGGVSDHCPIIMKTY